MARAKRPRLVAAALAVTRVVPAAGCRGHRAPGNGAEAGPRPIARAGLARTPPMGWNSWNADGDGEVWARPLGSRAYAIVLFNRGTLPRVARDATSSCCA